MFHSTAVFFCLQQILDEQKKDHAGDAECSDNNGVDQTKIELDPDDPADHVHQKQHNESGNGMYQELEDPFHGFSYEFKEEQEEQ